MIQPTYTHEQVMALVKAAKYLHDDIIDYATINNLGGYKNNGLQWLELTLAPFLPPATKRDGEESKS